MTPTILIGRRILLVEDEALVAFDLKEQLAAHGLTVLGPVPTLAQALEAVETTAADAAILDVDLARQFVWPAAHVLQRRGVPFVFLTGYAGLAFPEAFSEVPKLSKPADVPAVLRDFAKMLEISGLGG